MNKLSAIIGYNMKAVSYSISSSMVLNSTADSLSKFILIFFTLKKLKVNNLCLFVVIYVNLDINNSSLCLTPSALEI